MKPQLELVQVEEDRIYTVPQYEGAQYPVQLHLNELNEGLGGKHVHALDEFVHHQERASQEHFFKKFVLDNEEDGIVFGLSIDYRIDRAQESCKGSSS